MRGLALLPVDFATRSVGEVDVGAPRGGPLLGRQCFHQWGHSAVADERHRDSIRERYRQRARVLGDSRNQRGLKRLRTESGYLESAGRLSSFSTSAARRGGSGSAKSASYCAFRRQPISRRKIVVWLAFAAARFAVRSSTEFAF